MILQVAKRIENICLINGNYPKWKGCGGLPHPVLLRVETSGMPEAISEHILLQSPECLFYP